MKTTKVKAKLNDQGKVVGYIDERTGREYGFPVIFGRKRSPYGNGWIMNSQKALDIIAEDKDLKGTTLRVFLKVCARVDFENWVHLPLNELAEELSIGKSHISEHVKLLVKKGVLLKSEKIGRSYAYRLNPDFGWKGKVHHLEEYRQQQHDDDIRRTPHQFNANADFEIASNNSSRNSPKKSKAEIINFIESNDIDLDKLQEFIKKSKTK
jgi:hypothetical protein